MKKIIRVIGARPQIMQVKPLQIALKSAGFEVELLHTGQHYNPELSDSMFKVLEIDPPKYNLAVGSGSHGQMTAKIIERFEDFLISNKFDGVIVDGDTNTTLGAALAAVKLGVPVFHVEAGTRDLDWRRPEEINRIATDHIASLNFAPIQTAFENLSNEGLQHRSSFTGDVLLDNFVMHEKMVKTQSIVSGDYNLLTLHRPENTDIDCLKRFASILLFLNSLEIPTIFPIHPRSQQAFDLIKQEADLDKIIVIPPQDYFEFISLLKDAKVVLTDSGGVPREASWLGKRCIMIFKKMTWVDLVNANILEILLSEEMDLFSSLQQIYNNQVSQPNKQLAQSLFGSGLASEKITQRICDFYYKEGKHE